MVRIFIGLEVIIMKEYFDIAAHICNFTESLLIEFTKPYDAADEGKTCKTKINHINTK